MIYLKAVKLKLKLKLKLLIIKIEKKDTTTKPLKKSRKEEISH